MRKAWFVWEQGSTGPQCAIHYDSLPNAENVLNPKILQTHELDKDYFLDDVKGGVVYHKDEVTWSFNELCDFFPYTGDEYSKGETFSLDHKEAAE